MLFDLRFPAFCFPCFQGAFAAASAGEVGQTVRMFANTSCAAICCLLLWGLPRAILRTIISVVVQSAYRRAFWSFSHVGKEIFELQPPPTNPDTSSSIKMIIGRLWVPASNAHCIPRVIRWRSILAAAMSVTRAVFVAFGGLRQFSQMCFCSFVDTPGHKRKYTEPNATRQ